MGFQRRDKSFEILMKEVTLERLLWGCKDTALGRHFSWEEGMADALLEL